VPRRVRRGRPRHRLGDMAAREAPTSSSRPLPPSRCCARDSRSDGARARSRCGGAGACSTMRSCRHPATARNRPLRILRDSRTATDKACRRAYRRARSRPVSDGGCPCACFLRVSTKSTGPSTSSRMDTSAGAPIASVPSLSNLPMIFAGAAVAIATTCSSENPRFEELAHHPGQVRHSGRVARSPRGCRCRSCPEWKPCWIAGSATVYRSCRRRGRRRSGRRASSRRSPRRAPCRRAPYCCLLPSRRA